MVSSPAPRLMRLRSPLAHVDDQIFSGGTAGHFLDLDLGENAQLFQAALRLQDGLAPRPIALFEPQLPFNETALGHQQAGDDDAVDADTLPLFQAELDGEAVFTRLFDGRRNPGSADALVLVVQLEPAHIVLDVRRIIGPPGLDRDLGQELGRGEQRCAPEGNPLDDLKRPLRNLKLGDRPAAGFAEIQRGPRPGEAARFIKPHDPGGDVEELAAVDGAEKGNLGADAQGGLEFGRRKMGVPGKNDVADPLFFPPLRRHG